MQHDRDLHRVHDLRLDQYLSGDADLRRSANLRGNDFVPSGGDLPSTATCFGSTTCHMQTCDGVSTCPGFQTCQGHTRVLAVPHVQSVDLHGIHVVRRNGNLRSSAYLRKPGNL